MKLREATRFGNQRISDFYEALSVEQWERKPDFGGPKKGWEVNQAR